MYRTIKALLICLLFFAIYFSSSQSGSNNEVFAGAMARCCNNAICHDALCTSTSSILPCTGSEYISNCEWCMDVVAELRNCGRYSRVWPTWCVYSDGTKYYAN